MERTLVIIKPDGVRRNLTGKIIDFFLSNGITLIAGKMLKITKKQGEEFYYVHKEKAFYNELTDYIASGNIFVMVLEGENVITTVRKLMGATDPAKADKDTIRGKWGLSITQNTVHGSDSIESAKFEIPFFFASYELIN